MRAILAIPFWIYQGVMLELASWSAWAAKATGKEAERAERMGDRIAGLDETK